MSVFVLLSFVRCLSVHSFISSFCSLFLSYCCRGGGGDLYCLPLGGPGYNENGSLYDSPDKATTYTQVTTVFCHWLLQNVALNRAKITEIAMSRGRPLWLAIMQPLETSWLMGEWQGGSIGTASDFTIHNPSSNPVRSTARNTWWVFQSQKCCVDSLSACPTPVRMITYTR